MLPVTLTCPLWWVARWASRLLIGLALTAGLSVGATAPAHAYPVAPAQVALAADSAPSADLAPAPERAASPYQAERAERVGLATPVRRPASVAGTPQRHSPGPGPAAHGSRAPPAR